MKSHQHSQRGFALLVFLIVLMGLGGVVLTNYSQGLLKQVEQKNFRHNKRVLEEAKQALLQYAYNYPELDVTGVVNGPGRLPCTDTDNSGLPNNTFGDCDAIGRLPWRQQNLNLYDIRDADGQRLWYAASRSFATQTNSGVNSATSGGITLHDQSGNMIFDGSSNVEKGGVAAVIIAPGAAITRNGIMQDRAVANGDGPFDAVADTDPGIISPANYLDMVAGVEDNATLTQNSVSDGFILGPIDQGSDSVNDQFIVITAAEVIAMAEKATLQAYKKAIDTYRNNIGVDTYPWLDDYSSLNLATHDAEIGTRIGRVPSTFAPYFQVGNSTTGAPIAGNIRIRVNNNDLEEILLPATNIVFNGQHFSATIAHSDYYYWDEQAAPDGWELCPVVNGDENDCNQSSPGVLDPTGPNAIVSRVRRVIMPVAGPSTINFFLDYAASTGPVHIAPAAGTHAEVRYTFAGNAIDIDGVGTPLVFNTEQDNFYLLSFNSLIVDTLWQQTAGDQVQIGLPYYPVLPGWALASEDNWHDSIQMAYSSGFQPGSTTPGCTPGADCLEVLGIGGITNDKQALLVLAADHNFVDEASDGYTDDLGDIFDAENDDLDDTFDAIAGNDTILIMR